jgi:hypothetical protein
VLYRLQPHEPLEWCDLPGLGRLESDVVVGLRSDKLPWTQTEARVLSIDLLRIALRHGLATPTGLVVDAKHTVDLGRADELRLSHRQAEVALRDLRASQRALLEALMPGNSEHDAHLDARIGASVESAIQEAEADLAATLAAPIVSELAHHWVRLGGSLPD